MMISLSFICCCFFIGSLFGIEAESHLVRNDDQDVLRRHKRSTDIRDPSHPCRSFVFLNETERSTENFVDDEQGNILCDRTLKRHWYRFGFGSGKLPESCQPEFSCGTHSPIYLKEDRIGGHPQEVGREVFGRVCAVMAGNCCIRQWYIGIVNCGSYFVYRLKGTPGCFMAYCVDGGD